MLVVAIGASTFVIPWVKQVAVGKTPTQTRAYVLGDAASKIATERNAAVRSFKERARGLRLESIEKLDEQRRDLTKERAQLVGSISAAKPAWVLALVDQKMLLAIERSKLRVAVVDQELSAISAARDAAASNGASIAAKADLATQQHEVDRLLSPCNQANRDISNYEQRWRWKVRQWWENAEHQALKTVRDQRCNAARASMSRRDQLAEVARQKTALNRRAQEAFDKTDATTETIRNAGANLASDAERARIEFSGSLPERLRAWSERWKLAKLLRTAAFALALIIATPFLTPVVLFRSRPARDASLGDPHPRAKRSGRRHHACCAVRNLRRGTPGAG